MNITEANATQHVLRHLKATGLDLPADVLASLDILALRSSKALGAGMHAYREGK